MLVGWKPTVGYKQLLRDTNLWYLNLIIIFVYKRLNQSGEFAYVQGKAKVFLENFWIWLELGTANMNGLKAYSRLQVKAKWYQFETSQMFNFIFNTTILETINMQSEGNWFSAKYFRLVNHINIKIYENEKIMDYQLTVQCIILLTFESKIKFIISWSVFHLHFHLGKFSVGNDTAARGGGGWMQHPAANLWRK